MNTGYYGVYQIMIFRSKWNAGCLVRSKNRSQSLFKLTVNKKEAKAFDDDEIKYQGKLFDVVTKTMTSDSVTFFLYRDTEEQDALTDLVNYFSPDMSNLMPNRDKISLIKSFHGLPDQITPQVIRFDISKRCLASLICPAQISNTMLSGYSPVPTPPPRNFLI
jgi:hypothetical protein